MYELEDLARYLQPDVVADFSQVRFAELGPDRVLASGASGGARPAQLKATLGYRDGWIGEGQISYAGPGARERGALALEVLQQRLRRIGLGDNETRFELIGVNAMHGPQLGRDREPYEVRVRLACSGVNPSDVKTRAGTRSRTLPFAEIIPHSDGAATSDAVGARADGVREPRDRAPKSGLLWRPTS